MSTSTGAYAEGTTSTSTGAYAEGTTSTSAGAYAEDPLSNSACAASTKISAYTEATISQDTLAYDMYHQTKIGHKEISSSEDIIKTCFDYLSPVTSTLKIATQLFGRQPRLTLQFMMMHHRTKSGYKGFR